MYQYVFFKTDIPIIFQYLLLIIINNANNQQI